MNKKIFLTSAAIMCMACPAMAENFPGDGNMLENKTYANAAVYDNTGVYEGTVVANADYSDNLYTVVAGKYLPAASETVIDCNVPGSFCPGLQSQVTYNANSAQGLTSCSVATSGAYTLSDGTGTSADTCYATGNESCATRNPYAYGHATNVAYANSTNGFASCKTYYGDTSTCILDNADACEITGLTCENGYTSSTFASFAQGHMDVIIGGMMNGRTCSPGESGCGLGLTPGEGKGILDQPLNGFSSYSYSMACSDVPADANDLSTMHRPASEMNQGQITGKYCWLRFSKMDNINMSKTQWVFWSEHESAQDCSTKCGYYNYIPSLENYIAASLIAFGNEMFCEANTITINWSDVDPEYAGDNNEGTTTYGDNIRTPVKAITKPGKTFVGWKFVKPAATPVEP